MSRYRAVLFDWVGTLVREPGLRWRLQRAHELIGRTVAGPDLDAMLAALGAAEADPEVRDARHTEDTSPERHHAVNMLWFARAGLDAELSGALYGLDEDPGTQPLYDDVPRVLRALGAGDVAVAVVSDFHLDLRPRMTAIHDHVDALVVSSELGFQKPDLRMFSTALDMLRLPGECALMVGDRASHDGAAVEAGIDTLILPAHDGVASRGLDLVLRLVG